MTLSVRIRHALPGLTLDAAFEAPQGVTALFGRSGAGKTTLVNAVAGLLRPDAGRVAVDDWVLFDTARGLWLPPHRRRLGYVFQEGRLFPHMTVRKNLSYGARFAPVAPNRRETDHVVEMLGIGHLLDRRPGALSGGEKQRVAVGRALLSAPRLLLMDEPLAALDEPRKAEILPYLERLRDETDLPVLYVSHSVTEIARLATTVVVLDSGRVTRAGPAAEVLSDPTAVPSFGPREAGALVPGRIAAHHPDGLTEVEISGGRLLIPRESAAPGTSLRVRIEAKDVMLSLARPEGISALNILPATVTAVTPGTGPGVAVQLRIGTDLILARITRRSAERLGIGPGLACFAVVKSVAVAKGDVGGAG